MTNLLDFSGKVVVVTGAATGMGNESTRLLLDAGAEVHAVDVAEVTDEVASSYTCDLSDVDAVLATAEALPSKVDVLMNCAGIPNGAHWTPTQIMQVNVFGLRRLTEALLGRIAPGGAVTNIASIAGGNWAAHVAEITALLATSAESDELAWCEENSEVLGDGYFFSKEVIQYYTMWRSVTAIKAGVRINSICPGVTDTKMMPAFRTGMGDAAIDMTADVGIGRLAEAREMAPAMLFLSHSTTASYINGTNLVIDGGFSAANSTGQVDYSKYF